MIKELFSLNYGEESKQKTLDVIKNNISFKGPNLWILVCAIIVASVGLNVNSAAVVIGAMLISPLMGPIVGAGFALGIYDFVLLKKSIKNLVISTFASLIVATIYFILSPFKEAQSEILARTAPNIYDVIIAFFGGLAGVIAVTRVEKGNPIPGVAIATALMPPLCTAGFGLATGNYKYFFGALFLYTINCVFICIATFSIVKFLQYPAARQVDVKYQRHIKNGIIAIIILMLVPSSFFAYRLLKEQQFKQGVNLFIEKEFIEKGGTLVYKKLKYSTKLSNVELAFLNNNYSESDIKILNKKLKAFGVRNTKLVIRKNSVDMLQNLKNDILNEVSKNDHTDLENQLKVKALENKLAQNSFNNKQLFSEVIIIFPNIKSISLSNQNIITIDSTFLMTTLYYDAKPKLSINEKKKLKNWLQNKYKLKNIQLLNRVD